MKNLLPLLLAASLALPALAADAPPTKEQLEELIQQNKTLIAQNAMLLERHERPRSKEEAFAHCMQAARGEKSAMATESVSASCRQLLKGAQ